MNVSSDYHICGMGVQEVCPNSFSIFTAMFIADAMISTLMSANRCPSKENTFFVTHDIGYRRTFFSCRETSLSSLWILGRVLLSCILVGVQLVTQVALIPRQPMTVVRKGG